MILDLPPPLLLPPRPALVRAVSRDDTALVRPTRRSVRQAILPGWFPAGATGRKSVDASYQTFVSSGVDGTTYTFATTPIGTAATNRYIVLGVTLNATSITSVTIDSGGGAVAANLLHSTAGGALAFANIYILSVPTGTTATIVVTVVGGFRCGVGVWAVYNCLATAADTATANADNTMSDTINCPAGGAIIACAIHGQSTLMTWTGVTERYDALQEVSMSGASDTFATTQTGLTITATYTGVTTGHVLSAISLGPG